MLCEYCVVVAYTQPCTCSKDGSICPFVRRCNIAHKWLPLGGMSTCSLKNSQSQNKEVLNLKKGEYKVAYVQKNKLYIDMNGNLIRMMNPYDYEPKTVELVKIDNELYIKEFAPQNKKTTLKKENKSDEE